jgi:hypothetical protein
VTRHPLQRVRDSIGTSRKTASGNYCKTLSAFQRSDQKFWHFSVVIPVWLDKTSSSPSRDSIGTSRKTGSGNYCKTLSASNCRIKSYGPFLPIFRSGATRPPLQRVGFHRYFKENGLRKLMLNIEVDPTVGSKLMSHFSRYSALA